MMEDPRLLKLAEVMVDYSLDIRKGDVFQIRGEAMTAPLMAAVIRLAAHKGAHPFLDVSLPGMSEIILRESPEDALDFLSPIESFKIEQVNASLVILAETNPYHLSGVDPKRIARLNKARTPQIRRFMERGGSENPELRWCGTLFPCPAFAQNARMSVSDYENFVYHAMMLDTPDPVQAWRDFSVVQQARCDWLMQHDVIRVQGPDTDITFRTQGRKWVNADGKRNFPDGEVFTGPLEETVNGSVRFTYPTVHHGREAEDVRLTFQNGIVTHWEAKAGKELLDELFAMDDGARRLGEFAIGTNYRVPVFTRSILFDEKIGGTCHFAVGASIPETRGQNHSALHWDMICDLRHGGTITADGETVLEGGEWRI